MSERHPEAVLRQKYRPELSIFTALAGGAPTVGTPNNVETSTPFNSESDI
jgi:hypothetical protein